MRKVRLNDGYSLDEVGYGTWLIENPDAFQCVSNALKCGYRHIDSAQAYGNEEEVGRAIRESGIPREEIFLTTKVAAELKDYQSAKESIEESLRKLNIGYIDLMLIHCPVPWAEYGDRKRTCYKENLEVWKALTEAKKAGKIHSIGVSNFTIEDIKNIEANSIEKIAVNQICIHVGWTDNALIDYCRKQGIVVEAYSPLGHGNITSEPHLKKMAEKYGVTVAQFLIKYTLQLGTVSLPKAKGLEHMEDNIKLDFEISKEDMEFLKGIKVSQFDDESIWKGHVQ